MRELIRALYYPEMVAENDTVKKSIPLFDELHFMDRTSFTFGKFGPIAANSPLRQFERSFRENGFPLYLHRPPDGPLQESYLAAVTADIEDPEFVERFQKGLASSEPFRDQQIDRGTNAIGTEKDVAAKLCQINFKEASKGMPPSELLVDESTTPFSFSTPFDCAKELIRYSTFCSTKSNAALRVIEKNGFYPLADAAPYGDLLGTQYLRAVKSLEIPASLGITDLSLQSSMN